LLLQASFHYQDRLELRRQRRANQSVDVTAAFTRATSAQEQPSFVLNCMLVITSTVALEFQYHPNLILTSLSTRTKDVGLLLLTSCRICHRLIAASLQHHHDFVLPFLTSLPACSPLYLFVAPSRNPVMAIEHGRAERAPLLHRSTSVRAIYPKDDETENEISTARGSFIIASIGLLIFLQGMYLSCVV
jgi:hypothetical protein